MKKYTIITGIKNYNTNECTIYKYYWDKDVRKYDKEISNHDFFFVKDFIDMDKNKFDIEPGYKNVFGDNVNKIIPKIKIDYENLKLMNQNLLGNVFESDVNFLDRYLWEEKPNFDKNIRICYIDIEILRDVNGQYSSPKDALNKVASITFFDSFNKKYYVFLLGNERQNKVLNDRYVYTFDKESLMLQAFIESVKQLNPDYFTGWYIDNFDIPYLIKRMENLNLNYKELSPLNSVRLDVKTFNNETSYNIIIKGRGIIDLMAISKQFWLGTDVGYSLEAQSRKWLNEGKIEIGDIDKAYNDNFEKFVEYNVKDVELCYKLDMKLNLIKDMQSFQDIISINLYDSLIAGKIIVYYIKQNTNIILDNVNSKPSFNLPGGYVVDAGKGIYNNVHKFDFASHYPSIIRTYNISNDTIVYNPSDEIKKDLICFKCNYRKTDKGGYQIVLDNEPKKMDDIPFEVYFKKDVRGSITQITDELTIERLKQKKIGEKSKSTVLKRMINSIFGQLGYQFSRFYNQDCAKAITLIGQFLNKSIIEELKQKNIGEIVMGDTDSFAIKLKQDYTEKDVLNIANNTFEKCKKEHNIDKIYSELELEAIIQKMILFGVKKKYAQLIKDKQKIQGLEMIRKDCCKALKEFQTLCIKEMFETENPGINIINNVKNNISNKIRLKIKEKDYMYFAQPTVIKKDIDCYKSNTMEKKALENTGLKISINEMFYLIFASDGKVLAFKNVEELEKFNFLIDYERTCERVFNNINIFENLFIKQCKLFDY